MDFEIEINNNEISPYCKNRNREHHDKVANNFEFKLDTINMDCFLNILDQLDWCSLLDLSEVNEQFRAKIFTYEHIVKSKLFEIKEFIDVSLSKSINIIHVLEVNRINLQFSTAQTNIPRHWPIHLQIGCE